jgi:hypothetical protein
MPFSCTVSVFINTVQYVCTKRREFDLLECCNKVTIVGTAKSLNTEAGNL